MTINQLVTYVDSIKPNNFDNDQLVRWINEVEGRVQTEIFLFDIHEITQYTNFATDKNCELLVPAPYDKLYIDYLLAEIDNANGEYNKYANTHEQFNQSFTTFQRYIVQLYAPGNRPLRTRIHGREAIVDAYYQ